MTKGQSMVLEAGKEYYDKLKDSNIARDVFNHFKPMIDTALNKIVSNDIKEPRLFFDVKDENVSCWVCDKYFFRNFGSESFDYIKNEYKKPTPSQRNGLRLVLAEKIEKYLKSHPSVLEVLGWDLLLYDETTIEIAFKPTPNNKLRDW